MTVVQFFWLLAVSAVAILGIAGAIIVVNWIRKRLPEQERAAHAVNEQAQQVYYSACEEARAASWQSSLAAPKCETNSHVTPAKAAHG